MNILVCVKQVPDTGDPKFSEQGILKRDGVPAAISALVEYAVEEGLRLKEKLGGTVTVLTMGPPSALETLRHCIAMGADEAIQVTDTALAGSDALATSKALAAAIVQSGGAGLILCGAESNDGAMAYVGPALARALNIPSVTFIRKIEEIDDSKAVVQRLMEEGYDRVEVALPAVLTVVKEINEPRISSLKGKMRAKKYEPKALKLSDLAGLSQDQVGLEGSSTRIIRMFPPEARPSGQMLQGEPEEMANQLFEGLKKTGVI